MTLTINDLIERKDLIEKRDDEKITLEVKDVGAFEFRVPTLDDIEDMEAYQEGEKAEAYIVSACSVNPRFSDGEVVKAYEALDGAEVVEKFFKPGHVRWLSLNLLKAAGYDEKLVRVVEKTKN